MDEIATPTGPGRRALVTGASSGIGRAFAERLARDGYHLVLVARNREALEELAAQLREKRSVEVEVFAADLTSEAGLEEVEARIGAPPSLELLVNNAGLGGDGAFHESEMAREEEQIRVNVLALVRLSHAALAVMVRRGHGAIVNVSSCAAFAPLPYNATYGGTKAFVNSFTESLAEELRGTGVRVQALCPGFTRTDFQRRAGIDSSTVPDFAWMSPEDVVDASLDALAAGRLICVPGAGYRAMAALQGALPRAVTRRALAALQGRRHGN